MVDCDVGNGYDGRLDLRISSVFVILVASFLGAWFPVYASRHQNATVSQKLFFMAKYFGSGVIVATAFIHLLAPANEALTNPCLTGVITEYPWVEGICLVVIFNLFFIELLVMRFATFGHDHARMENHDDAETLVGSDLNPPRSDVTKVIRPGLGTARATSGSSCPTSPYAPGDDHLSHSRRHSSTTHKKEKSLMFNPDSYAAQMTAILILEFGVIFHSIFIGLTLAVAGEEFVTLFVVLVTHQAFEGLALGTRLASIEWPMNRQHIPYLLGVAFALSTPIAIAVGLGVRTTLSPASQVTLTVNGIFDSISAGILIYTGLVELMAHEFMFSGFTQQAPVTEVMAAFGFMCLGAGTMALLGKWA